MDKACIYSSPALLMRKEESNGIIAKNHVFRKWTLKGVDPTINISTRSKSSSHVISTSHSHPPPPKLKSKRHSFSKFFRSPSVDESHLSTWGSLVNHFKIGVKTSSTVNQTMGYVTEEPELKIDINMRENLRVPPILNGKSDMLSNSGLALLEEALPENYKAYNWVLLFSSLRDGSNFIQFYEKVKYEEPTYIVVETMGGEVFGGFASSIWKDCCKEQYYGHGECFLFKLRMNSKLGNGEEFKHRLEGKQLTFDSLSKYMWTTTNQYFQYSMPDSIGIGGGGEDFGLFLGEDFAVGSSGRCATFDNEPLCDAANDFTVCQVEVYGFTSAKNEIQARILSRKRSMQSMKTFRRK